MKTIIWNSFLILTLALAGCAGGGGQPEEELREANLLLSPELRNLKERVELKGFRWGAPAFVRIFKKEEMLELWLKKPNGEYGLFLDYPICVYSGELGPKLRQGDKQSPEGFYQVTRSALNPNSQYHLSFNLGFPNAYDRAHGYTGSYLMVHGKCVSVGCYAMGDRSIEEIYTLVATALQYGQPAVPVNAFPFRLTAENLAQYQGHRWYGFWQMLKPGYDYFEQTKRPPVINVVAGRYQLQSPLKPETKIAAQPQPQPAQPPQIFPPQRSAPLLPPQPPLLQKPAQPQQPQPENKLQLESVSQN